MVAFNVAFLVYRAPNAPSIVKMSTSKYALMVSAPDHDVPEDDAPEAEDHEPADGFA